MKYLKSLQFSGNYLLAFINDILEINNKSDNKLIITTEKDYVRLKGKLPNEQLFYLPIQSSFISGSENFDKTITNYVGASTRDR